MRIITVGVIGILLVATLSLIPISNPRYNDSSQKQISTEDEHSVSSTKAIIDEVLIDDSFESASFGFNDSLWNLSIYQVPSISWVDGDSLALESRVFSSATLESFSRFGPEVIADFEFTFTQGLCYFGIGWADNYIDVDKEWATNLRACQNGVFMDYIDTELFLVSYENGKRVATPITGLDLTDSNTYTLVWHNSLVSLYVNGTEYVSISRHIPTGELQFLLTTSGHHYLVKRDTLCIDRVTIGTLEWDYWNTFPDVSLIWPVNNSQVYDFDIIDLEIVGQGDIFYSWDETTNLSLHAPWDVPIPVLEGNHQLEIFTDDPFNSSRFQFEVIAEMPSIQAWNSAVEPVIDGELSIQEQNAMTMYSINLRGEDRRSVPVDILIGYYRESLYVGMITQVQDHWNSRLSLLVDGHGDDNWGDAEVGSYEDIRITISGPSFPNQYRGIYSCSGLEIQPAGITYAVMMEDTGLAAEFLVPVDCVDGNITQGVGFGIIASSGGYDAFYPMNIVETDICTLQIVQHSGLRPQDAIMGLVGQSVVLLGFFSLVFGVVIIRRKRGILTIEESLENETHERIRTLLQSHPQISLERLALLADTDTQNVREIIKQLQRRGLLEKSIRIHET
ncbi:MAG: hypothetical protein RTV31_01495 [Candidatus Thorarchaeota archaeon]